MRRNEKEITGKSAMESIINQAIVCRLGVSMNNLPYVIPLCFGYKDNTIYFHGALTGKKLDIIRENPNVCVEFDVNTEVKRNEKPCSWGMKFQSVIGFGKASFIEDIKKKRDALDIIMCQYGSRAHEFDDKALEATSVIKVEIDTMTGKQSGF